MTFDKSYLRKIGLIKRRTLAPYDHAEASQLASQILVNVIRQQPVPAAVAGYAPIKAELDVIPALRTLAELGYATLLPVISENEKRLQFYPWRLGEMVAKNAYGINEPTMHKKATTPDVILVPLLAFDRSGQRLGYGAGYYDVTLQALRTGNKKPLVIGVAFSMQEEKSLLRDEHDQLLDMIVTEKETIKSSV